MRPRFLVLVLLLVSGSRLSAQDPFSLALKKLKARSIGPAVMSGRVTDVAVFEKDPAIQYVASASGGVWKTTNHGTTWTPVFDKESTSAIGTVALSQENPDRVWVGTGEANPRNSASWGHGVFHSGDGGKTWKNMGLRDTHHIGRIVLHPNNPGTVYVAALGHVWGPNKERGIFKTEDGGKTWQPSLALDEDTGCVDLAMDPAAPDILYACAWPVRRDAFSGGNPARQTGPKGGIYRTKDGGQSWEKLTRGLPMGGYGRCGVSIFRDNPNIVYAVIQTDKTIATVQGQPPNQKLDLAAGGIFRSDDKGETWKHLNSLCPRPFYYGQIRVDPKDVSRVYVLGIQFHLSSDGGKTFGKNNAAKGTHVDYHALWINPKLPSHLILGCDGGLNYSFDRSITWEHLKNLPISQFYAVGVDNRVPYRIYGGLQDNGSWGGPSATRDATGISTADWTRILGYDGYYCQVDPDDPDTVYAEGQYGILHRINVRTWSSTLIKPALPGKGSMGNIATKLGKDPSAFRFNWCSPILLSKAMGHPLYYGGNVVFRSDDRGNSWKVISPDLTRGKPGPSPYNGHTITTLAERVSPDTLYAGTDDGRVQVTRDGGSTWNDISTAIPDVPQERWITRLECCPKEEGTVYLTIDRHRNDDRKTYVYRGTDFGKSWKNLADSLPPEEPAHVLRVDPLDPRRLYLGTEYGLYFSFNQGKVWHRYLGLPTVPVHDLTFANHHGDLVIATHGRGLFILDLYPLRHLHDDTTVFLEARSARAVRPKETRSLGIKHFHGENPPSGAVIDYYFRKAPEGGPNLRITDPEGKTVAQIKLVGEAGLHRIVWNLQQPKTPLGTFRPVAPGRYTATLVFGKAGSNQLSRDFMVEADE